MYSPAGLATNCPAMTVTTAPNPDANLTGNGPLVYKYTVTFSPLAWTRATDGDTLTLRAYSPLVYGFPNAFNLNRGSL